MDLFIIVFCLIVILIAEFIIIKSKKKPEKWQEQNKNLVGIYSKTQFLLLILFIVYLLVTIINYFR